MTNDEKYAKLSRSASVPVPNPMLATPLRRRSLTTSSHSKHLSMAERRSVMKTFVVLIASLLIVACQFSEESKQIGTASPGKRVEETKRFEYTTLPDQPEWDMKLDKPLDVVRQEIQSTEMPGPVWAAFPIPETTYSNDPNGAIFMHMPYQTGSMAGSYGMDSAGCVAEALIKTNGISHKGWGIAGGQYAYYQRVEVEDPLLYDPRQYAFLIFYAGAYLEVTFPDLKTMHVMQLKAPDMSNVKHCGPGDNWRCRFEDCD